MSTSVRFVTNTGNIRFVEGSQAVQFVDSGAAVRFVDGSQVVQFVESLQAVTFAQPALSGMVGANDFLVFFLQVLNMIPVYSSDEDAQAAGVDWYVTSMNHIGAPGGLLKKSVPEII